MAPETIPAGETPTAALLRMMRGFWISQSIFVAARLGLADLLRDGPRSCESLAAPTGVPAQSLYRLLRALASVGIFAEVEAETFALTPLAEPLRSDVPGSLHAAGIFMGNVLYPVWNELLPGLRTGQSQFEHVFGTGIWEYLAANPELGGSFQHMMASLNTVTNGAVATAYDFATAGCVVDVAGGNGSLLAAILQVNPKIRGILFDLPYVQDQARQHLTASGVLDRCELIGGDFFESVPSGGDIYLLRWILHDYDDARCLRILQNCRAVMPPAGRLLIVELVVPDHPTPDSWVPTFLDLQMLLNLGGQERTAAEFDALFAAAGFRLERILPTPSPMSILEGIPA